MKGLVLGRNHEAMGRRQASKESRTQLNLRFIERSVDRLTT